MSHELLAIIEQLEREKGIKKEVLIEAVESALLSATRKVIDIKPGEELKIELDRSTGKIKAFRNNEEITCLAYLLQDCCFYSQAGNHPEDTRGREGCDI